MTKADRQRFSKLQSYGCVCCKILGVFTPPEIHHIVDKGYRKHSGGHDSTIPLCQYHHRGVTGCMIGTKNGKPAFDPGPSLAHGSKPFHKFFGTQRELLAIVNEKING